MLQRSQKGYLLKWRKDSRKDLFSVIGAIGELDTPLDQLDLSSLLERECAPITMIESVPFLRLFYTEPPAQVVLGRRSSGKATVLMISVDEPCAVTLMDHLVKETRFRPSIFPGTPEVSALDQFANVQETAYDACRRTYLQLLQEGVALLGPERLFLHATYRNFLARYKGVSPAEAALQASKRFEIYAPKR